MTSGSGGAGPSGALGALVEAVDRLAAQEPTGCGESLVLLCEQWSRLEAIAAREAAAFDASGAWAEDGARNASLWLARRCGMAKAEAKAQLRLGRHLRHLPVAEEALLAGEIGCGQVRRLGACRRPGTEQSLAKDEPMLVEHARRLRYEDFERVCAYWLQLALPDEAEEQRARRSAWLAQTHDDCFYGRMAFDPLGGTVFDSELKRLEQVLFEAEWAEARERLGGAEPTVEHLERTSAQRRADALVEMAIRSRSAGTGDRRPAPLLSVFVGFETLYGRICELANGTVVSPGSLLRHLDGALVERAVFSPGPRVEVSETGRFFTGALRRAIVLRDRRCTHPLCDRPAEDCEVDHIVPFSEGGLTTEDNGRLLCPFHNRLRNQRRGRPPPDIG